MNFCRRQLKNNFTIIDNEIFKNSQLSLKSKGLLCTMLSFSGRWELSIGGLSKFCNCGKEQIRTSLNEIIAAGFLVRGAERRDDKGRFHGCDWVLYDEPQLTENRVGFSDTDYPRPVIRVGFPASGNPTQTNNKQQATINKHELTNNNNNDVAAELLDELKHLGVSEQTAATLVSTFEYEVIKSNLDYAQSVPRNNLPGFIVKAIKSDYAATQRQLQKEKEQNLQINEKRITESLIQYEEMQQAQREAGKQQAQLFLAELEQHRKKRKGEQAS